MRATYGRRLIGFAAGVVAVVACLAVWIVQPIFGQRPRDVTERVEPAVLQRQVEYLTASLGQRQFFRPATLERTARYIENAFAEAGGRVAAQAFEVEGQRYRNIEVSFGPEHGRPVIVGAHYDVEENTLGADDNASGVVGLLELARALGRNPPRVPVRLVAFTLEEPPYFGTDAMGSRRYVAELRGRGLEPRLVLVLEMIGYFDAREGSQAYPLPGLGWLYPVRGDYIALVGNLTSVSLVRRVKGVMRSATTLPVQSINAPTWIPGIDFSDHASFWAAGMPALMVTDTAFYRNPHYHRSSDLPNTLDYPRMAQVVEAVLAVVRQFDNDGTS